MKKPHVPPLVLLLPGIAGIATSVVTGLMLLPRVRLVEVLTVVGSAVGGGAAMAAAMVEFRRARAAAAAGPAPSPARRS